MFRPRPRRTSLRAALALALACAGAPAVGEGKPQAEEARPELALMGTIPIYWGEAGDFSEMLDSASHAHWARAVLERQYRLVPMDWLGAENLAESRFLLMAQPRALSAEENVALDNWVRAGGRLLLFADPMMTGESRFPIGDRRRPHDVVLLSPILSHWGLQLQYDAEQTEGVAIVDIGEAEVPVNLSGALVVLDGHRECVIDGAALVARCAIGAGHVLVLADAAVLDFDGPHAGAVSSLSALTGQLFRPAQPNAGNRTTGSARRSENQGIAPVSADRVDHVDLGGSG